MLHLLRFGRSSDRWRYGSLLRTVPLAHIPMNADLQKLFMYMYIQLMPYMELVELCRFSFPH